MISIIFFLLIFGVFGKLAIFALKAAWGITKFIVTIFFLPLILISLFLAGAVYIALPILIVIGIISLFLKIV